LINLDVLKFVRGDELKEIEFLVFNSGKEKKLEQQ